MSRLFSHFKLAEEAPPPSDAELRQARLRAARACPAFTEIKDDLVPRLDGRRWVSVSSDRVYKKTHGQVFATGSAELIATHQSLSYIVSEDGTLRFFEVEPRTWSEQVAVQARRRVTRTSRT